MTTTAISPSAVRERAQRTADARRQRRERAWEAARAAAALLKSQYHAARVAVFGSLTDAGQFGLWSDVDLAVWGIMSPADYFEAVTHVLDIGGDIKIDLIMAERCKPSLHQAIERGMEL